MWLLRLCGHQWTPDSHQFSSFRCHRAIHSHSSVKAVWNPKTFFDVLSNYSGSQCSQTLEHGPFFIAVINTMVDRAVDLTGESPGKPLHVSLGGPDLWGRWKPGTWNPELWDGQSTAILCHTYFYDPHLTERDIWSSECSDLLDVTYHRRSWDLDQSPSPSVFRNDWMVQYHGGTVQIKAASLAGIARDPPWLL